VAIDIIPLLYPNQQQFYPEVAPEAVTGLDDYVNNLIAASDSSSDTFLSITMDAILTVVQQHLSVALDVKTGHLQLNTTDITEQDIVSQIAAKVIASIKISVINGDLTIEGSD
jgi:hypothetical protein